MLFRSPEELQDFDSKPVEQEVVAEPIQEKPAPVKTEGKIKSESFPPFDRKEAFKLLAGGSWHKADLATYSEKAFGKKASKDLTDQELKLFVQVVQASPFEVAIKEVAPDYETDVL